MRLVPTRMVVLSIYPFKSLDGTDQKDYHLSEETCTNGKIEWFSFATGPNHPDPNWTVGQHVTVDIKHYEPGDPEYCPPGCIQVYC